jgi:hypothetical protein
MENQYDKKRIFNMNNKLFISGLIFLFFLFAGFYYLIFQEHKLEDHVSHYSFEAGNIDSPYTYETVMTSKGLKNDYSMFVNYESTGAFMAGREISVSLDFIALNKTDRLHNSNIWVVFPGALIVPITNQNQRNDATIELKFINGSSNHAIGKDKIIYYMPDYYNESVIFLGRDNKSLILPAISDDPRYTYFLIINGVPQKPDHVIIKNRYLSIAPLETYLQLKINNWIIFLTIIAASLTLIQIMRKDEK